MIKKMLIKMGSLLCAVILPCCFLGCAPSAPENVSLELWHYYTGDLQVVFDEYITDFNDTVGMEKNITIKSQSFSGVKDLTDKLNAAANKAPGSLNMPGIYAAYTDTAFMLDKIMPIADLKPYFTADELGEYVPAYLQDGTFSDGRLAVFPTVKANENMIINEEKWDEFAAANPLVSLSDFYYGDSIVTIAEKYYNWSGGKALYGRDALDNYILAGFEQAEKSLYTVNGQGKVALNFDKDVMKSLWNNYYVPYVKGWFSHDGSYVTDCLKTENLISGVGSTSASASYPSNMTLKVMKAPLTNRNSKRIYVSQGAGLAVTKADAKTERAAAEFLKWFTESERNINYSLKTGYLPVKLSANNYAEVKKHAGENVSAATLETIRVALETIASADGMYTAPIFENSNGIRSALKFGLNDACKFDKAELNKIAKESGTESDAYREKLTYFLSDGYYNTWYNTTLGKLNALVA